eukprot:15476155-Alexandrium_andersonii.AAC.1
MASHSAGPSKHGSPWVDREVAAASVATLNRAPPQCTSRGSNASPGRLRCRRAAGKTRAPLSPI